MWHNLPIKLISALAESSEGALTTALLVEVFHVVPLAHLVRDFYQVPSLQGAVNCGRIPYQGLCAGSLAIRGNLILAHKCP